MAPSSSITHSHSQAGQENNNSNHNNNNNNISSLQGSGAGAGTNSHHNPSEPGAHHQSGTSAWQHSLDELTSSSSPSSSAYKRMSHPVTSTNSTNSSSQHYSNRPEHPTPLSIALPLSNSRPSTNGSTAHHQINGPSGGSFSAGYLDQRRDTFHSLTHHNHHSNHTNGHSISNGYNNNSNVSWQTSSSSTNNIHDDTHHNHHTHHPQPIRPQSISYASHQHPLQMHLHNQHQQSSHHAASPTTPTSASQIGQDPTNTAAIMRRRRLSTASTSSKRGAGSSNNLRLQKAPNTPHHTRRFTTLISDQEPDTTYLWGYLLFFCTMVGFTVSMYALVASNYMPLTGNKTLDWIKKDSHYCMLVPITIPVTVLFVLFNWLGMKLFRHN